MIFLADANASGMGQVIQYEEFYESYLKIDGNKAETYSSKNEVSIKRNQVADESQSHQETVKTTTCEDHQDHRKTSSKVVMVSMRRTSIDRKSTASEYRKKKGPKSLKSFLKVLDLLFWWFMSFKCVTASGEKILYRPKAGSVIQRSLGEKLTNQGSWSELCPSSFKLRGLNFFRLGFKYLDQERSCRINLIVLFISFTETNKSVLHQAVVLTYQLESIFSRVLRRLTTLLSTLSFLTWNQHHNKSAIFPISWLWTSSFQCIQPVCLVTMMVKDLA